MHFLQQYKKFDGRLVELIVEMHVALTNGDVELFQNAEASSP